jgi:hypothetical protein
VGLGRRIGVLKQGKGTPVAGSLRQQAAGKEKEHKRKKDGTENKPLLGRTGAVCFKVGCNSHDHKV